MAPTQTMANTTFIIITIFIALITKGTKGDITCTAVSTPHESTITCSFGVDIPETKHGINIKYYESPDQRDGDTILMCNYISPNGIICLPNADIGYLKILKENAVIKRKPHHQRGGQYKCQVSPSMGVAITPCNITFTDVPISDNSGKSPSTSTEPRKNSEGQEDMAQHTAHWTGYGTFVLLFLFICVIVLVIILYWKRQRIRQWWKVKRSRAQESADVETGAAEAESLTDSKEDQSSLGDSYGNKDKSLLDPMNPDTEKEMPAKTHTMLKGVYEAPVVREARLDMTRDQWLEQKKQKEKMAKAEKDRKTREGKSWLDPMNPDTEKQMPVKDTVKKGVYEAPVAREARLDITRDQWLEQKKQKEKMAKAEKDRKTRERTSKETTLDDSYSHPDSTSGASSSGVTRSAAQYSVQPVTVSTASPQSQGQWMPFSTGEDANRTDPQVTEVCVPLMEGRQEPDRERNTVPLTVDEARRKLKEAEANVKEKNKTQYAAWKAANKHSQQVLTESKEAKEQYKKARKELKEARLALKTATNAENNIGKEQPLQT